MEGRVQLQTHWYHKRLVDFLYTNSCTQETVEVISCAMTWRREVQCSCWPMCVCGTNHHTLKVGYLKTILLEEGKLSETIQVGHRLQNNFGEI